MKSKRWFLIRAFFHGMLHPFETEQNRELYAWRMVREWSALNPDASE